MSTILARKFRGATLSYLAQCVCEVKKMLHDWSGATGVNSTLVTWKMMFTVVSCVVATLR